MRTAGGDQEMTGAARWRVVVVMGGGVVGQGLRRGVGIAVTALLLLGLATRR